MPYGTAEDPNIWGLWFSMLEFPITPINKLKKLAVKRTERIKKLARKSLPLKLKTKINLDKISSKQDFIQLLNFELFDFKKHPSNSADLFHMFLF